MGEHQPEKQETGLLSQSLQLVDQENLLCVVLARKADVQSGLTPLAMSSELPTGHIRLLSVTGSTAVWWLGSKKKPTNQQRHFLTTPKSHSIPPTTLHLDDFPGSKEMGTSGGAWKILAKGHLGRGIALLWKCHLLQPPFCLQKFMSLAKAKNDTHCLPQMSPPILH